MQRSKQEGLGAAFGGGITESVWGAQTSQVLVKATVWATVIFFGLSLTLARLYAYRSGSEGKPSAVQLELEKPVAPATPATSGTSAPTNVSTPSTTPTPASSATSTTPATTPAPAASTAKPAAPATPANH